jgi:hypothetical protein
MFNQTVETFCPHCFQRSFCHVWQIGMALQCCLCKSMFLAALADDYAIDLDAELRKQREWREAEAAVYHRMQAFCAENQAVANAEQRTWDLWYDKEIRQPRAFYSRIAPDWWQRIACEWDVLRARESGAWDAWYETEIAAPRRWWAWMEAAWQQALQAEIKFLNDIERYEWDVWHAVEIAWPRFIAAECYKAMCAEADVIWQRELIYWQQWLETEQAADAARRSVADLRSMLGAVGSDGDYQFTAEGGYRPDRLARWEEKYAAAWIDHVKERDKEAKRDAHRWRTWWNGYCLRNGIPQTPRQRHWVKMTGLMPPEDRSWPEEFEPFNDGPWIPDAEGPKRRGICDPSYEYNNDPLQDNAVRALEEIYDGLSTVG